MGNSTSRATKLAKCENREPGSFQQFFGFISESKSEEKQVSEIAKVAVGVLAWPIARLSKQDRFSGFVIRRVIREGDATAAIEFTVSPDPKLGMPTMLSLRLLFAFMKIGYEQKEKLGFVPDFIPVGGWNGLCNALGLEPEHKNRTLLKRHLQILHSTAITSKKAFKTSRKAEGISDKFFLVPSIKFKGDTDGDGIPHDQNYVRLSKPLRDSIENNYVKTIDLTFLSSLKTDIAQLLYTKLSYLFQEALKREQAYVEFTYQWIVETMGLKTWNELWRAKQQLHEAFGELVAQNYIEKAPEWMEWTIRIYPGIRFSLGEQVQLKVRREAISTKYKQRQGKRRLPAGAAHTMLQLPSVEDEREIVLARQAAWILAGRQPEIAKLQACGWTIDDAMRKTQEIRDKGNR